MELISAKIQSKLVITNTDNILNFELASLNDLPNNRGDKTHFTQFCPVTSKKTSKSRPSWIFSKFRKDVHHTDKTCFQCTKYQIDAICGFGGTVGYGRTDGRTNGRTQFQYSTFDESKWNNKVCN